MKDRNNSIDIRMRIFFLSILLSVIIINPAYSQQIARVENIRIDSKDLEQEREILVYTPKLYDESPFVSYDVVYVLDAQNREFFDYAHSTISFISNNTRDFIVIGITSPYNRELNYGRNNDFLPVLRSVKPEDFFGGYSGNADKFLKYIKDEVVPYVDTHYRTRSNKIVVGHSLSASFIIYSFLNEPGLFDNYIAISPNLAYDGERLVNDLAGFDYGRCTALTYLFLSNADEGVDYWQDWKPARERVYRLFRDSVRSENLKVAIKEFPDESHWSTFAPALDEAFTIYLSSIIDQQHSILSSQEYRVTISVTVPEKDDDVYITGNQSALANWDPSSLKMDRTSDLERKISLVVHSPAEFKFTRGSWETEAVLRNNPQMQNIMIKPEEKKRYHLEIVNWIDHWR